MSGVAAVLTLTGDPARSEALLDEITGRLRHRGAHGHARICDGRAALAHLYLDTGVATHGGIGPWRQRPDGPVLSGDLAIINGPDLAKAAGCPYQDDACAILAAYDRWGLDMCPKIEGEFAFVIWDGARQRLCGVRDRFGVKPLAFKAKSEEISFASEPAALACSGESLDDGWIARFLAGDESDPRRTAFRDIFRVPAGHMVVCENAGVKVRSWWQIEARDVAASEAPEALAEALDRAVRLRLQGDCATLLSGGLDSSAMTCLAARHSPDPIRAISMRYRDMPALDEGVYIDAVRALGNIKGIDEQAVTGASFDDPEQRLREQGYPFFAPGQATAYQTYRAVAASGARAVIEGHGGDEVIGTGVWYYAELARQHHWGALWTSLRQRNAFDPLPLGPRALMARALRRHGPRPVRGALRLCGVSYAPNRGAQLDLLSAHWAKRLADEPALPDALTYTHEHLPETQRRHAQLIQNAGTGTGFEILDRAGVHSGIELRYPFYDRHVVAITLGQHSREKIADGQPRALLRRAMKGILPETVRLRRDKIDFTPNLLAGVGSDVRQDLARLCKMVPPHLQAFITPEAASALSAALDDPESGAEPLKPLWRLYWLDRWLRMQQPIGRSESEVPS
ncbi:asparagine synthase-related protein [Thioclava indica]|uniref:asparagine synthase (glutamine-hydrolyzing) n=1 Tax=Thioclava indica TaxID=1353528 RepID=A0A074JWB0_9RHOB|nr:asparagine synthase-related protein [Thioclava indica]KEO59893.1 hypothetical protein DT23_15630 [Thioclava indica]